MFFASRCLPPSPTSSASSVTRIGMVVMPGGHGGCSSAGRAPGCGPGRRGFESRHSPQIDSSCRLVPSRIASAAGLIPSDSARFLDARTSSGFGDGIWTGPKALRESVPSLSGRSCPVSGRSCSRSGRIRPPNRQDRPIPEEVVRGTHGRPAMVRLGRTGAKWSADFPGDPGKPLQTVVAEYPGPGSAHPRRPADRRRDHENPVEVRHRVRAGGGRYFRPARYPGHRSDQPIHAIRDVFGDLSPRGRQPGSQLVDRSFDLPVPGRVDHLVYAQHGPLRPHQSVGRQRDRVTRAGGAIGEPRLRRHLVGAVV